MALTKNGHQQEGGGANLVSVSPSQPTARRGGTSWPSTNFSSNTIWDAVITWAAMMRRSPGKEGQASSFYQHY
ncbi:hypothetical protein E2C01_002673 [Portunus trituberculatus]|uniref:Uncharacterized protein n=1 Tax=Portunus trituberculatus TaxID=210409 RepID=A0A5B7CKJ2_PORTR|nr:hypothetical protein [Portunus trituberculatus]